MFDWLYSALRYVHPEGKGPTPRDTMGARAESKEVLTVNSEPSESQDLLKGPTFGARHSLALWVFFGLANLFAGRVATTITLVAMASDYSNSTDTESLNASSECDPLVSEIEPITDNTKFDWSDTVQGFVLSAFYYGYFVTQLPGGVLAKRVGGKRLFAAAVGGCSILSLLTPVGARIHVGVLIAIRVVQGCLQGIVLPAVQDTLSIWVPSNERSRTVGFTFAGCSAGTVVGTLASGYLSTTSIGWPVVYYIEGALGLVWTVGWMVFTYDVPARHPKIQELERLYIESSVERPKDKGLQTPWASILSSPALYGIAAAHFANDWGAFALMTCLPKFMKDILQFDLAQNGVLSSLPYLATWVCNMVAGFLADFLRKPNRLRTVQVRKLMVTIGLIGPAALLIMAAYLPGCNRASVVALLTLSMGLSGFNVAGYSCNHLDIAPAFAAILFAMTNTCGTTSGLIGPPLATVVQGEHTTRHSWQMFFLLSGAIFGAGGLIFVLFARGEVQAWAKVKDTDSETIVPPRCYGSIQAEPGGDVKTEADLGDGYGNCG